MIPALLGGLGTFLLGMVLLTDGLKALAGDALRRILTRFVAGPLSGVGWGALVTALVQSSTATSLTTVGFVSAGLLTFPQAVGVVFGANLGTTSTGWIVSQLGFKVSMGSLTPPLVLLGAVLRLLSKGRLAHAGTAVAGFALLFMGIDLLQAGMGEVAARLTPDDLPTASGGLLARLALFGFGFVMTVVMQSSSAAMTTTLAAVASGALGLEQAAVLVVGQNVGTTPTAIAAAVGATAAAKRTAWAHVLFNLVTALVALAIWPWLLPASLRIAAAVGADDAPTALALFHTLFNVLGVALLLPGLRGFSRLVERLVPERGPRATRFLAPAVAELGPVALEAARRALVGIFSEAARAGRDLLGRAPSREAATARLAAVAADLGDVAHFVHRLGRAEQAERELVREQSILHAADHLDRLAGVLRRIPEGLGRLGDDPVFRLVGGEVAAALDRCVVPPSPALAAADMRGPSADAVAALEAVSRSVAAQRKARRVEALRDAAAGRLDPDRAMARVDALLWLDGVAYHVWRAAHHLREDAPDDVRGEPARDAHSAPLPADVPPASAPPASALPAG